MKKSKLLLLFFIILQILYPYKFLASLPTQKTSDNTRLLTGVHKEVDDVGNNYYYTNEADLPGYGDFRGHYKNGYTYRGKYNGQVQEDTVFFITLDQTKYGIDELTVIFCVEPDKNAVWVDDTTPGNSHYQSLTATQKENVSKTVSAVTGLFSKTGNYDYLAAGQLLVWEAVGATILETPSEISPEISQIRNVVNTYDVIPSFLEGNSNPDFELIYNRSNGRYELYLQDNNSVLDEHFLSSLVGVQNAYHIEDGPNSDDLYIWTDSPQLTTQVIKGEYNFMPLTNGERANIKYRVTPTFINSGQDLVSGIPYENKIQFDVHTKEAKGEAKLKKCGYENGVCSPLSGVIFGLYDENDNLIRQAATSATGEITFSNLSLGKYYVKEIYAPPRYKTNEQKYNFEIVDDGQTVLINGGKDIENKLVEGTVSLKKVGIKYNNDDKLYPLEGVEFTIYKDVNENSQIDESDRVVETLITDVNGEIHSSLLEYGQYIIKETATIDGYINNGYEETFFIQNDNENIELLGGMDLVNNIKKGKVDLTKEGEVLCDDECPNTKLEGVEFTIYKDENSNKIIDEDDIEVETLITDAGGYVISHDLIYGEYIIKETNTLPGYELIEEEYPFTIDGSGDVHLNNGESIINQLKTKKIEISKKDQFDTAIPNVEFEIYKDINLNSELDEEDEVVEVLITDEKGKAYSKELAYGNYILAETKAPEGYIVDFSPYPFVINDDTYNQEFIFNIYNKLITGDVNLTKRDNDTNETLEGVEFELYKDINENEKIDKKDLLIDTYKTSENGEIQIQNLPYGQYLLKETKPLEGYYLSKQVYKINIDGNQDTYKYEIYNQKIKKEIVERLVNTSNNTRWRFLILLSCIFIIILLLIIKITVRKQNYI